MKANKHLFPFSVLHSETMVKKKKDEEKKEREDQDQKKQQEQQKNKIWMMTSIFLKMEYDLIFLKW